MNLVLYEQPSNATGGAVYRAAACGTAAVWIEESGAFCNGVDISMSKVRTLVCQPSLWKEIGELPLCAETSSIAQRRAAQQQYGRKKAVDFATEWTYSC